MRKEKIIFLLPPSEGKCSGGTKKNEKLSFSFPKPLEFFETLTPKDLKCMGKRFEEGKELNKNITQGPFCSVMQRYDGVMFGALDYQTMSKKAQTYFDEHFYILSGMYGILRPQDIIGNYKLPIETKGLLHFWGEKITDTLNSMKVDIIVDLLPQSYKKMIHPSKLSARYIEVDFLDSESGKKISHGVKKVKGERVRKICEDGSILIDQNSIIEISI